MIIHSTPYDYPLEVLQTENGNYRNICNGCAESYNGPKRSYYCYSCWTVAKKRWDALTPEQQNKEQMETAKLFDELKRKQE